MRKIDLQDVSFLFLIKLDSVVRLENLLVSLGFIIRNFNTNIKVFHVGCYDNGFIKKLLPKKVEYKFIKDEDNVFYRTKYINMMVMETKTPIFGVWDADVIIPRNQIILSVEDIRNGFDVSYPYDGHFYDTSKIIRDYYIVNRNIELLTGNVGKMRMIYGNDMKGGAFLSRRESYIKSGMENENFYGWGPEDFERYSRWINLGYRISRISGNLYHLTHSRGENSKYRSQQQIFATNKEYMKTKCSARNEILDNFK